MRCRVDYYCDEHGDRVKSYRDQHQRWGLSDPTTGPRKYTPARRGAGLWLPSQGELDVLVSTPVTLNIAF